MIEYNKLVIGEELLKGLRPGARSLRNSLSLTECMNLKPTLFGLKTNTLPTQPFANTSVVWPFPQIFIGSEITLACYETTIKQVDMSTWPWTETTLAVKNFSSPDSAGTIIAGGPWHFCDQGYGWFLTNGSCLVFKTFLEGFQGGSDSVFVTTDIIPGSCCEHRTRTVFADFSITPMWSAAWKSFWTEKMGDRSYMVDFVNEPNTVYFSSFGGIDTLFLLDPALGVSGPVSHESGYDFDDPMFIDMVKRNEFGTMPMEFPGQLYKVSQLGSHILVVGEYGVGALSMIGVGDVSTFSRKTLISVGACSRSAIGGDVLTQLIVDKAGICWIVDSGLSVTKLDYSEYLLELVESDSSVVVTYDSVDGDYYISDGSICYVLSKLGLSRVSRAPTALTNKPGLLVGPTKSVDTDHAVITTDTIDFGLRGIKTIHSVELSAASGDDIEVSIYYRYDKQELFQWTDWIVFNNEGVATPLVSGVEFQVSVRAHPSIQLELDTIHVTWYVKGGKRSLSRILI